MRKVLVFFSFLLFCLNVLAEGPSCFPTSPARHDYECYGFEKAECLKVDDIYSCGWGKKSTRAPSDDEILVCDDSRCSNNKDGHLDDAGPDESE